MFRLIRAHRNFDSSVTLWGRDEFGKHIFIDESFRPYFYCPEYAELVDERVTDNEWGFKSAFGDDIRRVYVQNPTDVKYLREKVEKSWEADIPYARRYLIDRKITSGFSMEKNRQWQAFAAERPEVPIYAWFLDIECLSSDSMPDAAKDAVTCISVSDGKEIASFLLDDAEFEHTDGTWAVRHFDQERELLQAFCDFYYKMNPDIISGWNIEFDASYLLARCKQLKVALNFDSSNVFDLLTAYKRLYRRRSYRLKDIVIDEDFEIEPEPQVNYAKLWREEREVLLSRNKRHAEWVAKIDQKLKIIDYNWSLKELAGMEDINESLKNSILIDTMMLRRAKGALPTREDNGDETFEGAYTMQPEKGVFKGVLVADMSRFYPTAILSEQLDPLILHAYRKEHSEEKVDWAKYKEFCKGYTGDTLLTGLVKELSDMRDAFTKAGHMDKIMPIKGVLNSAYGVVGSPHFRMYSHDIGSRVTEVCREIIQMVIARMREAGYRVIYSDTDSIFLQISQDQVKLLIEKINELLAGIGSYTIKAEHYFSAVAFTGVKKRYFALDNGELTAAGFEIRRTDSSAYTREIQMSVMRMVLEDKHDAILPYLKEKVAGVKTAKLDDICITKSLSKDPDEYTGNLQSYIKTMKESELKLKAGDFVKMIPCSNYPHGMAVWQDESELKKKPEIDFEKIIDSQIRAKVEDIISLVGIAWGSIVGKEQGKLF